MADIQEIYAILLARQYQEELFRDLPGKRKKQKGGQETLVDCPFCQKSGKFSYNSTKPVWRCWTCGEAGDWLKYLEKAKGLDFGEGLILLADVAGVEIAAPDRARHQAYTKRASLLETAQELFVQELIPEGQLSPEASAIQDYLLSRGYSVPEWQSMELGAYTDRDRLQRELMDKGYSKQELRDSGLFLKLRTGEALGESHQLTLLWRDPAGRAMGLQARSILDREELKEKGWPAYLYSAGLKKSQGLVGLESARGAEKLIMVEGALDALSLKAKGLPAVALGGTSLSPAQVKALQANRTEEILLALDRDEPGQMATEKAIQTLRLSELRAYVVSLPEGYKDPDELVRAHQGVEAFQDCLDKAEGWPKWMARRIVSRQDISTDRGRDRALDEALEFYEGLEDGLERRDFWDTLRASVGLPAEELSQKLEKTALRASQRASREKLQQILGIVQQRASQGDVLGAEAELESGLQELRTTRGAQVPEPYLVADLEADILATREGLQSGWDSLDSILKIPQGALTIVAGRPGHGKTTLLLNMLANMLRAYPGRAFYYFSYEEARKFLALKLIMLMGGQMISKEFNLEAHLNYFQEKRGTEQAIEKAIQEYQQLTESGRLLISDSMPAGEDLAATIGWLARGGETGAVFVDYIQKIPLRQPGQQRYLELKRVSELLLQQAVRRDIPIILGAQLGRAKDKGSKVTLDNLRESGDIEQDANLVLGLLNESVEKAEEEEPTQAREVDLKVTVLKQRGGVAGRSKTLSFDRPVLRVKDKQQGQRY